MPILGALPLTRQYDDQNILPWRELWPVTFRAGNDESMGQMGHFLMVHTGHGSRHFYPWPTKETCHPLRNGRLVRLSSFNVLQLQLLFHQHLLQQHLWHRWRTVYWRKSEVMRLNRYCVMLKVMFLIPSTGGAAWRNVSLIVWLCPKLAGYSSIFCWMLATFQCI